MDIKKRFVITISRQLGSGGAYIGQRLAKNLNVFYADREIISQAARQLSVVEADIAQREEKTISFWDSFFQSFSYASQVYIPPEMIGPTDRALYEVETEIIQRIASEGSAVIIGRCSTCLFSHHPNHLSIYLHANLRFRKARVQELYNISEEAAEKMILQSDKDRAQYYRTFAGREWSDVNQFDLALDTGKLGLEKSEALIMGCLE